MTGSGVERQATDPMASWVPKERWSLAAALRDRAASSPDSPFMSFESDEPETFSECLTASESFARRLIGLGVRRGDRVAILASNSLDHVHLWFGLSLIGAAEVPLNTAYRGNTLSHGLNLSGARVVVTESEFLPRVAEVERELDGLEIVLTLDSRPAQSPFRNLDLRRFHDLAPSTDDLPDDISCRDVAAVVLTSGTTGPSKGVLMPHGQIFVMGRQTAEDHDVDENDIVYFCHTLFHSTKFMSFICAITAGCPIVVDERFMPARWSSRIRESRATYTIAHGPMLDLVCAEPSDGSDADNNLRVVISGASTPDLQRRFIERFAVEVTEGFGMTEIGILTKTMPGSLNPEGSCGVPHRHLFEVRVADPDTDELVPVGETGELHVRPKLPWTIMQGYLGMPEKTAEAWRNLWFHTGDLVRSDSDGHLFYVTRAAERIRRRAENISAYEIELAASQFAEVRECAAVGVPSEFESSFDDDVMLAVVPRSTETFDSSAMFKYLVAKLPHYMVPRYIKVLDALPRTPTSKVQKALIRQGGSEGAWDRVKSGLSVREVSRQLGQ